MLTTAIVFKGKEQCTVDMETKFNHPLVLFPLPVVEEELRI